MSFSIICFPYLFVSHIPDENPPNPCCCLPSFISQNVWREPRPNTKSPHLQKSKWNMLDSQASQTNPDHKSVFHRGQKHTLTMSILLCSHIVYRRSPKMHTPTSIHSSLTQAIHSQGPQDTQEPSKPHKWQYHLLRSINLFLSPTNGLSLQQTYRIWPITSRTCVFT